MGIISSVSDAFCSSCNRARISADGKLYTRLFSNKGYNIQSLLKSQTSDEELVSYLKKIWTHRRDGYSEVREDHTHHEKIEMSRN